MCGWTWPPKYKSLFFFSSYKGRHPISLSKDDKVVMSLQGAPPSGDSRHRRHDTLNPHFPADIPFTSLQRCVARYPYHPDTSIPTDSPKLSFERGDIIVILSKDASGWWNGMLFPQHAGNNNAQKQSGSIERPPVTGWFPATYVDPCVPKAVNAHERSKSVDAVSQTQPVETSQVSPQRSDKSPSVASTGSHYADELAGLRQSLSDLKLLDIKVPPSIQTKVNAFFFTLLLLSSLLCSKGTEEQKSLAWQH